MWKPGIRQTFLLIAITDIDRPAPNSYQSIKISGEGYLPVKNCSARL
jgi:hypothetical protein